MKFIPLAQPLFGEEEKNEVFDALESGWVTLGPRVKQFEDDVAKYVGAKFAVGLTSCTAAEHLALLAAGIGPGDEVITSPFTFATTANTSIHVGAKPIFADIDPKTYNIDPKQIEKKITKKTKAIVPVHYAGQPADMDAIMKIAKKHNLIVIEDAAHAIGTEYKGKRIGTIGDMTCFSFHAIKNISTGDGGMVTTNNEEYAEKLNLLRLHGMSKEAWKRHTAGGSWKYDILLPGFKYNMTDVSAALGIQQLKKIDAFIKTRQKYAEIYDKAFSKVPVITIPYVMKDIRHARNLYSITVDFSKLDISRDDLIEELKEKQIGANVYFMPLHLMTFYRKTFGYKEGDFPVTERVSANLVTIPLFPKMTLQEVKYVAKTVSDSITNHLK